MATGTIRSATEASLPGMEVALARQQTVAEQEPRPLQGDALRVRGGVRHEHLLDERRVVERDPGVGAEPEAR